MKVRDRMSETADIIGGRGFQRYYKTVDFVVYTYKDFWTDSAVDKKVDLKIFITRQEPRLMLKFNGKGKVPLYWEGYYSTLLGKLYKLEWDKYDKRFK